MAGRVLRRTVTRKPANDVGPEIPVCNAAGRASISRIAWSALGTAGASSPRRYRL
jgi:hypothetical protein